MVGQRPHLSLYLNCDLTSGLQRRFWGSMGLFVPLLKLIERLKAIVLGTLLLGHSNRACPSM